MPPSLVPPLSLPCLLLAAAAATIHASSTDLAVPWDGAREGSTVRALHNEYNNIFKYGNRNAASHLWASFLLDRASQMSQAKLEQMFSGFCAVSGSPIGPNDYNRYMLRLPSGAAGAAVETGFMHYCCWPCVCDTQDFLHVDTKTVRTRDGDRVYRFVVIGNPCEHPERLHEPYIDPFSGGRPTTIARDAQEVRCDAEGRLIGATLSDHGYIILNMFFDLPATAEGDAADSLVARPRGKSQPGRISSVGGVQYQDEHEYLHHCQQRAANGYNSGMGEIFRRVAAIAKINVSSTPALADVPESDESSPPSSSASCDERSSSGDHGEETCSSKQQ